MKKKKKTIKKKGGRVKIISKCVEKLMKMSLFFVLFDCLFDCTLKVANQEKKEEK